jgi:hypothetical protein
MHPMEHLRYVARSGGGDQRMLVDEPAMALRGLRGDPAGLVVACRRITERHPVSGALWWLCSHVVTAADPLAAAQRCVDQIEGDDTVDQLIRVLPDDARVCMLGWPDLVGEVVALRGEVRPLIIDVDEHGDSFARQLMRADIDAELVPPSGLSAAVLSSDIVLVEAWAAAGDRLLASRLSHAAAAVAYCAETPVWAVVGTGRGLPEVTLSTMIERIDDVRVPWDAEVDVVPLGLCSHVAGPGGLAAAPEQIPAECPPAPELLRLSPM